MAITLTTQKALAQQLADLVGISSKQAATVLKKYNFNIQAAANAIYNGDTGIQASRTSTVQLEKLFDQYRDANTNEIGIDGTIKFITDLGLELEDPVVLAIAKELESPGMGRFSRTGFISGWSNLNATSIETMKSAVQNLQTKMASDRAYFTQVYRFTFTYNLQDAQRLLPLELAVANWNLLLASRFDKLPQWVTFVTENYKRNISKDTWNMLWEFVNYLGEDPTLEQYNTESAWPSVIDEFVAYLRT